MQRSFSTATVILLLIFSIAFLISCKKSSAPVSNTINFIANLNGASETPSNSSAGSGTAVGSFNNDTKILTVTTTYSGTSSAVTGGHIHKGLVGVPGPVIFPFTSTTSPIIFTSVALDVSQETDLKENKFYVNLHTSTYPGGEIRGQLNMQ